MAKGGRKRDTQKPHNSSSWGTGRGNKRGTPNKQVKRREMRMERPRVRNALDETRQHQASIQASIQAEAEARAVAKRVAHVHTDPPVLVGNPPRYACCGARVPTSTNTGEGTLSTPKKKNGRPVQSRAKQDWPISVPASVGLPLEGDGNGAWTLGQARSMLRQGYLLAHVVNMTGWGTKWFSDMKLEDGRGVAL